QFRHRIRLVPIVVLPIRCRLQDRADKTAKRVHRFLFADAVNQHHCFFHGLFGRGLFVTLSRDLIRSSNLLAGSLFGSCGTSLPLSPRLSSFSQKMSRLSLLRSVSSS